MFEQDTQLLAKLNAELANDHMMGEWVYDDALDRAIGGPKPSGVPYIWRWQNVHSRLLEACKALPDSKTARRTLSFMNPGLPPGTGKTTHTLTAAMQMVLPGELAWAHKHAIAAIRFCVEGSSELYTVVDGERLNMETHDLILTPAWSWHDHHNDGSGPGIWMDSLDFPVVLSLGQLAYEKFGDSSQPIRGGWNGRPRRFPWTDVAKKLDEHAGSAGSPFQGVFIEYQDPKGNPVLPALSCNIQMLRPGLETKRYQCTSSSICLVLEGEGTTVFNDQEISWGAHDLFVIPQWAPHRFVNRSKSGRAVLFVINDTPLLKRMDIYREQAA